MFAQKEIIPTRNQPNSQFAQKEIIPTRNQPNSQFEKIFKISFRFTVTTNQSFWEIEILGESSKSCKDYLGRASRVPSLQATLPPSPQIFSVISDTSCHTPCLFFKNTNCVTPQKKNSERAPGSNNNISTIDRTTKPWHSGQRMWLTRNRQGFDSPALPNVLCQQLLIYAPPLKKSCPLFYRWAPPLKIFSGRKLASSLPLPRKIPRASLQIIHFEKNDLRLRQKFLSRRKLKGNLMCVIIWQVRKCYPSEHSLNCSKCHSTKQH